MIIPLQSIYIRIALLGGIHGRRALAHAYLANYLRYHTAELEITRDANKAMTFNVNSNITESRIWNH